MNNRSSSKGAVLARAALLALFAGVLFYLALTRPLGLSLQAIKLLIVGTAFAIGLAFGLVRLQWWQSAASAFGGLTAGASLAVARAGGNASGAPAVLDAAVRDWGLLSLELAFACALGTWSVRLLRRRAEPA